MGYNQPAIVWAQAKDQPRIYLLAESLDVEVGQETDVEVRVTGAEAVYGVELHLLFDPRQLEIARVAQGDFLSPNLKREAFILLDKADNQAGTLDYALSLLHPAPEVSEAGLLLTITFRAKESGPAQVTIGEALFGNRAGQAIRVAVQGITLNIAPAAGEPTPPLVVSPTAETAALTPYLWLGGLIFLVGAIIGFLFLGSLIYFMLQLWRNR